MRARVIQNVLVLQITRCVITFIHRFTSYWATAAAAAEQQQQRGSAGPESGLCFRSAPFGGIWCCSSDGERCCGVAGFHAIYGPKFEITGQLQSVIRSLCDF